MTSKTYHPLNWHIPPWGNANPNDWLEREGLARPDGTPVWITKRVGAVFVIRMGNDYSETAEGLLSAWATLNALEVGQWG